LVEWIADNQSLASAVAQWHDHIALDTEFIRTNTYYPMPGLYQIATGENDYLIDPLCIDEWQPFKDYLVDPHTTKIMHACLEDLELLHHHLGVNPQNVFDTQYANAFLSTDFSLSYAALVERAVGVELLKHETRSNWLQRPLSDEQLKYAVEDVTYLLAMYSALVSSLEELGRDAWFGEDMRERARYEPSEPMQYYRNVKKAWQLPKQQLAVLQTLCAWREDTARTENVPRSRVIWDDHLFEFARVEALATDHVHRALPRGVARRYADLLVEHHRIGRSSEAPGPLPRPLTSAQGTTLKSLRSVARSKAETLGIAPELLARKRDLEHCIRHHAECAELSPHYSAWRGELVGAPFLDVLEASVSGH
jgi:ribonuclease D